MGCHIKNPKNPYEVHCLFIDYIEDFSLYFHSVSGQQDLVADCVYKEKYECFFTKEGFNMTVDDGNIPTIAVADTVWKQTGRFICQKGGQLLNVSCPFPATEISTLGITSKGGLNTTRDENFMLNKSLISEVTSRTPGEDNTTVIIGAAIGAAVLIIMVLVISILLFKKCRSERSPKCHEQCNPDENSRQPFLRQISTDSRYSDVSSTDVSERSQSTISSSSSDKPLLCKNSVKTLFVPGLTSVSEAKH